MYCYQPPLTQTCMCTHELNGLEGPGSLVTHDLTVVRTYPRIVSLLTTCVGTSNDDKVHSYSRSNAMHLPLLRSVTNVCTYV